MMNSTNISLLSFCGPVSWKVEPGIVTSVCITFSVLSCAVYLANVVVSSFLRQDSVKRAVSCSACVNGLMVSAFLLPISLVQLIVDQGGKSLKLCLLTQGLQVLFVIEFTSSVSLFFLIPLLILSNPVRQTVLEKNSRLILLFIFSLGLPAGLVVLPLISILVTTDDKMVPCCGWQLFPPVYIYSLVFGVSFPFACVSFVSSYRMVYLARQKAKQTVVPVTQGHIDNTAILASSRRKQRLQCRWFSIATIHFFLSFLPFGVLVSFYVICPFCVNSELILFVVNFSFVCVTTCLGLSNFYFKENRETIKRLCHQCKWRKARVGL